MGESLIILLQKILFLKPSRIALSSSETERLEEEAMSEAICFKNLFLDLSKVNTPIVVNDIVVVIVVVIVVIRRIRDSDCTRGGERIVDIDSHSFGSLILLDFVDIFRINVNSGVVTVEGESAKCGAEFNIRSSLTPLKKHGGWHIEFFLAHIIESMEIDIKNLRGDNIRGNEISRRLKDDSPKVGEHIRGELGLSSMIRFFSRHNRDLKDSIA